MVLSCRICSRNQWGTCRPCSRWNTTAVWRNWTQTSDDRKSLSVHPVVENESSALSGSERLVGTGLFSGGTGLCSAVLRGFRAPGDHAVAWGGHCWICADPLHNAGQTVQTGDKRPFPAAGVCDKGTKQICFQSSKMIVFVGVFYEEFVIVGGDGVKE